MTATASSPGRTLPPPLPPGALGATPDRTGSALPTAPSRAGRPTPWLMRLWAAVLVVAGVLVALAGAWSFASADAALARADADAAQLVRLQELQTSLVTADASVTNAFLVGGLEPPERRAVFDDALTAAAGTLAAAARAQPADGAVLAVLNVSVLDYAAGVERARAANRQALPVGAQHLRDASSTLRSDALPALDALIQADEARAATEFAAAERAWVGAVLASALGVVLVAIASVWLARRTHRYLNLPLAGAAAVLLVLLAGSAVGLGAVAVEVDRLQTGPFAAAGALSQARLAGFDAKANESLALVSRGSGQAFEEAWVASSVDVTAQLQEATAAEGVPDGLASTWDAYAARHVDIRALDDGGAWEDAVEAATSDADTSADAAFTGFDVVTADALEVASAETSDGLADARRGLLPAAVVAVLAGLAAAALCAAGLARRIEEYR